jgi:hypothetical protein
MAMSIGRDKQLFVDDHVVADVRDLKLTVHPWQKHSGNPLLRADRAWEQCALVYGSVMFDDDDHCFKMWYWTYNPEGEAMCYALSNDGLTWDKPNLGICEYAGSSQNNIVMVSDKSSKDMETYGAIKCPWDSDPARLYKTAFWQRLPDGRRGVWTATSPDGLHWTKGTDPVDPAAGDTVGFYYDSFRSRYVVFVKTHTDRFRSRAQIESEDFVHWTEPQLILKTDDRDDQPCDLYNNSGFVWGAMRLGLLQMFEKHEHPYHNRLYLELMYTADGVSWQRMPRRETVLDVGADGEWDRTNQSQMNGAPVAVGNQMYTYYGGRTGYHGYGTPGENYIGIGLATMRLDGFVSRDANPLGGQLTTVPVQFTGSTLKLNVKADWGQCAVEILDETGNVINGYGKDDCLLLRTDAVDQPVSWRGQPSLSQLVGRPVCFRFHMKNAQLYAFWVE